MIVENARRGRRVYRYLRCDTVQKKGAAACRSHPRLPLGSIEELVVSVLREQARVPGFGERVRAVLQGRIDLRRHDFTSEANALPKAIGEASGRAHTLALALPDTPDVAKPVVKRQLGEACAILQAKQGRLAEVQRELGALQGLEADAAWIGRTLGRFDKMWDALTDANRVILVQTVVAQVIVDAEHEQVRIALVGAKPRLAEAPMAAAG
jgi:hypothetical protein